MKAQIRTHNWSNGLINSIITIVIALLLIFVAKAFYSTIIVTLGVIMAISGISFLIYANKSKTISVRSKTIWYAQSLINILAGLFMIFQSRIVFELFSYFIAVWLVIIGGTQIFSALTKKSIVKKVNVNLINGILAIAIGVSLLIWPELPFTIIGYITLAIGIFLLVDSFLTYKKSHKKMVSNEIDAEDIEVVEINEDKNN